MKNISLERLAFILANTKNNLEIYLISQIVADMNDEEYVTLMCHVNGSDCTIQTAVYSYAYWHSFDHLIADAQIQDANLLVRAILYREGVSRELCNAATGGVMFDVDGIHDLIEDAHLCPDDIVQDIIKYKDRESHNTSFSMYRYRGLKE